jgi:DNA polymerase IV
MKRNVVHMDLDSFFVSCERLQNSALNGIPLIIGGSGDRGVVASCSYEARAFGVRSAMPMKMALRLCPQAKIVRGDMDLYSKQSQLVSAIIDEQAPTVEKASIDEFYLDITGLDKFFGCYKWTAQLTEKVTKETGLPISFGLSINKTVSKIATSEGKPHGKMYIPEPQVQQFMYPLSVKKIPMVGDVTYQFLCRVGIRTVQTLAEMPMEAMHNMLGKNGIDLWRKANAIDETPVQPHHERKSISSETTFPQDSTDVHMMHTILLNMVEKLCYQLRTEDWLTSVVTIKIRYNNFDTHTQQCKIAYTSCDHILRRYVKELFEKVYERRMRIRLIGIKFGGLVRGNYQINLFEDTQELVKLYQTVDGIKNRFGSKAIALSGK